MYMHVAIYIPWRVFRGAFLSPGYGYSVGTRTREEREEREPAEFENGRGFDAHSL